MSKVENKAEGMSKDDRPMDRPMTGILTVDDGRRTEHGIHPLDPSYNGTKIASTAGFKEAVAAREEAGLSAVAVTPGGTVA